MSILRPLAKQCVLARGVSLLPLVSIGGKQKLLVPVHPRLLSQRRAEKSYFANSPSGYLVFAGLVTWVAAQIYFAQWLRSLYRENCVQLTDEEESMRRAHFGSAMEPREFKKFVSQGTFSSAAQRVCVIEKGQLDVPLILVISGSPDVVVDESVTIHGAPGLFGEMSIMLDTAATASVYVTPGCNYVYWSRKALVQFLEQEPYFKHALDAKLSHGLAQKVISTNEKLAEDTAQQQYKEAILRFVISLMLKHDSEEKCDRLLALMQDYRSRMGISDALHDSVLKQLIAIDVRSLSLAAFCEALVADCPKHP